MISAWLTAPEFTIRLDSIEIIDVIALALALLYLAFLLGGIHGIRTLEKRLTRSWEHEADFLDRIEGKNG